jgi:hypothetical protein
MRFLLICGSAILASVCDEARSCSEGMTLHLLRLDQAGGSALLALNFNDH